MQTTSPVPGRGSRVGLLIAVFVAELGVFLDSLTTQLLLQQSGLNLESNLFSRELASTGYYILVNALFMLILVVLAYFLYRQGFPRTVTIAGWGFLALGLVRGFFGVNNLLIISGLHPII